MGYIIVIAYASNGLVGRGTHAIFTRRAVRPFENPLVAVAEKRVPAGLRFPSTARRASAENTALRGSVRQRIVAASQTRRVTALVLSAVYA